jgi:hypothetical protein
MIKSLAVRAPRLTLPVLFVLPLLQVYLIKQDAIICEHLRNWVADTAAKPQEIRSWVQRMNALTSQEVFAGGCMDSKEIG